MSIKKRLSQLENRYQPTGTSPAVIKDLESLAYDLCDSDHWPQLNEDDDVITNLKRIVPAPGEPIENP